MIEEKLGPIRGRIEQLMQEPQYLQQVLAKGADKASNIAEETWQEVRGKVGLS